MRTQYFLALSGLLLAGHVATAAKLEHDDVPNRCWPACGPVVGISAECDAQHDTDSAELLCICNWTPAKTQIPLCAACIFQYSDKNHDHDDDNDDNEALEILHSCSFSTTTYNAAAATTLSISAISTNVAVTATTTTDNISSTASGIQGTNRSSATDSTATPTSGAAVGLTVPRAAPMAAIVGLMPLAWI